MAQWELYVIYAIISLDAILALVVAVICGVCISTADKALIENYTGDTEQIPHVISRYLGPIIGFEVYMILALLYSLLFYWGMVFRKVSLIRGWHNNHAEKVHTGSMMQLVGFAILLLGNTLIFISTGLSFAPTTLVQQLTVSETYTADDHTMLKDALTSICVLLIVQVAIKVVWIIWETMWNVEAIHALLGNRDWHSKTELTSGGYEQLTMQPSSTPTSGYTSFPKSSRAGYW